LTPRQKEIARSRILADSSVEIDEKVNIADAFAPFKSGLYWIWILISELRLDSLLQNLISNIQVYLSVCSTNDVVNGRLILPRGVPLASVNNFLPQVNGRNCFMAV
jgi:hypothetical protein